jgi:hypothetical protein
VDTSASLALVFTSVMATSRACGEPRHSSSDLKTRARAYSLRTGSANATPVEVVPSVRTNKKKRTMRMPVVPTLLDFP